MAEKDEEKEKEKAELTARAAETAKAKEGKPATETVPGGKYEIDGRLVNAQGEPLDGEDNEEGEGAPSRGPQRRQPPPPQHRRR